MNNAMRGDLALWFDVEKRYKAIASHSEHSAFRCGLM